MIHRLPLRPVERNSAVNQCAHAVRTAVLRGDHRKGERLPPERVLATELKVNRTTLRAALTRLVDEGVLSVKQGSGYTVNDLFETAGTSLIAPLAFEVDRREGFEMVRDLLELRRGIAAVILKRLAARKPNADARLRISNAVDAFDALARAGAPYRELATADLAILSAVVAATGSSAMKLVLNPITAVLKTLPGLQQAMYREPLNNVIAWHTLVGWMGSDATITEPLLDAMAEADEQTLKRLKRTT